VTPERERVTTLELFFDLVFVFTITQLTSVLTHEDLGTGLGQVVLMLTVIFWMYGGYAWLTNAVTVDQGARRVLLLGGMAGFLVLALAIPEAFHEAGAAFGIAYLGVVVVHTLLFLRADSEGSRRGIVRIAPFNLVTALLVLAGGLAGGTAQYVLWGLAAVAEWLTPRLIQDDTFEIAPSHFVERHGLVVIVAIGESVVAIGIGAEGLHLDVGLAALAIAGLLLSGCLWWTYFGGDDTAAEDALADAPANERPRLAIDAWGYAHLGLLLGVIAVASGVKHVLGHPGDPLPGKDAVLLAGGAALFLASDAVFRHRLRIGTSLLRAVAALAVLVTIPVGTGWTAAAQLTVLLAVFGGALLLEAALTRASRRSGAASRPPAAAGP
jgi:low temperature requirement protein LtrA